MFGNFQTTKPVDWQFPIVFVGQIYLDFYHTQTKLGESNVFIRVCLSMRGGSAFRVGGGGGGLPSRRVCLPGAYSSLYGQQAADTYPTGIRTCSKIVLVM